jgi:alpha-L-fucosidase
MIDNKHWFSQARFGLFIHYSLFSMLERGEWVMNRERIQPEEMRKLAERFDPRGFDADYICDLACESGMRYINLTTMHHEGFRLYDSELSDFNSMTYAGRDLVEELVTAARKRDLQISLYHSLNNWYEQPDAVAALESRDAYAEFIASTHARIKELVTRFNPIDCLWYDGWWPFNAEGWQAEKMNAMVREIQPEIIFNGRNGLPGDFGTPEGHLSSPTPWRPWEACITFNDHWGFHRGDHNWKNPNQIIQLLATAAQSKGNLLFNIGPRGDGSVPEESVRILKAVGDWVRRNGEAVFDTDLFTFSLTERGEHNGDWSHNGPVTLKGNTLYHIVTAWPGAEVVLAGISAKVDSVEIVSPAKACAFTQEGDILRITGLPECAPDPVATTLRIRCQEVPSLYTAGGMRIPDAPHPPYDPCPSDIAH